MSPDAIAYAGAIGGATSRRVSAATFLEAAIVIDGSRDPVASRRFDDLCRAAQLVIEPVTEAQARIAREAYRDFGKGAGIRPGSTSATALPMHSPEPRANGFSSRGTISSTRTYRLHSRKDWRGPLPSPQ